MRCIDRAGVSAWAERSGISLDAELYVDYVSEPGFEAFWEGRKAQLLGFARMIVEWIPPSSEKMLIISPILAYPPDKGFIIGRIRGDSSIGADLEDYPGIIMRPTRILGEDYQGRSKEDIDEESTLVWLIYFLMFFAWGGDLLSNGSTQAVKFGDGFCAFHSDSVEEIREIKESAASFGFELREF